MTNPNTTSPSGELKPCPFCGCLAWLHSSGGELNGDDGHRVECEGKCHAMTCWWHTKAEAITAWNARSDPPPASGEEPALPFLTSGDCCPDAAGYCHVDKQRLDRLLDHYRWLEGQVARSTLSSEGEA